MDYLEKGSPVRQNIRQDVYNSTNFVGRVDTQSLESKSISTESLDIDFTDTLSYLTEENYGTAYGFQYSGTLGGWVDIDLSGDFIGAKYDGTSESVSLGITNGSAILVGTGIDLPSTIIGSILEVKTGDYSGSTLASGVGVIDQTSLGGSRSMSISSRGNFIDPVSGDKTQMGFELGIGSSPYYNIAGKTNNSGEGIVMQLDESTTGFLLLNTLSDNTASVLRIEDNNGDARLEVKNDGVTLSDLTIDFTDTLSYVTSDDLTQNAGKVFVSGLGWLPIGGTGDAIVSEFEDADSLIRSGLFDLDFDSGMGILPLRLVGDYFELKSGTYSGSVISNAIEKTPFGDFVNTRRLFVQDGSDNRSYDIATALTSTGEGIYIAKTNESGELVAMDLVETNTGFNFRNSLSDNTASVLRIEDNNGDAILEFFNDYLMSETIPALDYADDAAAALGGVPVGGIYHNSGTIRIRLT